jgi:hypothetical protein
MSDFQKEVRTSMRSAAEIEADRNHQRRSAGIVAFIDATNAPGGGDYGYQVMLEWLFQTFESDHGAGATISTVLEALKPVLRNHHDLSKVASKLDKIIDELEASK